ncbi:MAG: elongation factor P [Chloroflexi bacterium]|nr:MAG: elongation factor P [Chloroflexota bacterium]
MIETGDLRKGSTIEVDGALYQVIEVEHLKIGRGSAQVRMKLRDLRAGHIVDKSVQAGSRFARARVERQPAQYLYAEGNLHYFMNTDTYDQFPLGKDQLGGALNYLRENATCNLLMFGDEPVGVELPAAVELAVTQTDPWVRGDTAQGGTKPAQLETGISVNVPLFVNAGDVLKIDTRTGEYLERANK